MKRELVDDLSAQLRVELQKLFDEAFVLRDAPAKSSTRERSKHVGRARGAVVGERTAVLR